MRVIFHVQDDDESYDSFEDDDDSYDSYDDSEDSSASEDGDSNDSSDEVDILHPNSGHRFVVLKSSSATRVTCTT